MHSRQTSQVPDNVLGLNNCVMKPNATINTIAYPILDCDTQCSPVSSGDSQCATPFEYSLDLAAVPRGRGYHQTTSQWTPNLSYQPEIARIISNASHEVLIEHHNPAYIQLLTENRTYRNIFDKLVDAIPQVFVAIGNPLNMPLANIAGLPSALNGTDWTLPRNDKPNDCKITFWKSKDWRDRGSDIARPSDQKEGYVNKTLAFVEYENGQVISKEDADAIRRSMRQVWNEWLGDDTKPMTAPTTWSMCGKEKLNYLYQQIYPQYPYLALCKNHWKINQIATLAYPSWCSEKVKSLIKQERSENPLQTANAITNRKRSQSSAPGSRKRSKTVASAFSSSAELAELLSDKCSVPTLPAEVTHSIHERTELPALNTSVSASLPKLQGLPTPDNTLSSNLALNCRESSSSSLPAISDIDLMTLANHKPSETRSIPNDDPTTQNRASSESANHVGIEDINAIDTDQIVAADMESSSKKIDKARSLISQLIHSNGQGIGSAIEAVKMSNPLKRIGSGSKHAEHNGNKKSSPMTPMAQSDSNSPGTLTKDKGKGREIIQIEASIPDTSKTISTTTATLDDSAAKPSNETPTSTGNESEKSTGSLSTDAAFIAAKKGVSFMRPTNANTPRNIFAIDYFAKNPSTKVTREEFSRLWDALDAAERSKYDLQSKEAKTQAKARKAGGAQIKT